MLPSLSSPLVYASVRQRIDPLGRSGLKDRRVSRSRRRQGMGGRGSRRHESCLRSSPVDRLGFSLSRQWSWITQMVWSPRVPNSMRFDIYDAFRSAVRGSVIQRVFSEVIGKPFLRALLFPYAVFLLLVSAADASTNWTAARRQMYALSPAAKTLVFVGLISGWCLVAGRALRPVWGHKTIPFLLRQPIGSWELSVRLLPSLSVALIPVILIWWLASYEVNPFTHYLGFVGLALPIMLGASFRGITSVSVISIGIAALALLVWTYSLTDLAAYLGMLTTIVLIRAAISRIGSTLTVQSNQVYGQMSRASVIRVLVARDWRSILRSRRTTLIELIVLNLTVTAMMLGFRVNGQDTGRDMLLIACVLFLIAALPAYRSLEIAKARLGAQMMRLEWPVTCSERALALIALTAKLAATSALPIALVGSRMGVFNLLVFSVFVVTTVFTTAALFAKTLGQSASSVGLYLNLILFHGVLISLLAPWHYLLAAAIGIVASVHWMRSGLRNFTTHSCAGDSA